MSGGVNPPTDKRSACHLCPFRLAGLSAEATFQPGCSMKLALPGVPMNTESLDAVAAGGSACGMLAEAKAIQVSAPKMYRITSADAG